MSQEMAPLAAREFRDRIVGLDRLLRPEMLQAERTGERDKHLPHRMAAEVECADALTRLLIYAGFRNAEREDHKPENRR